jgi:hypothetical protein
MMQVSDPPQVQTPAFAKTFVVVVVVVVVAVVVVVVVVVF